MNLLSYTTVLCSKVLVFLIFWQKTFLTHRHLLVSIEPEKKVIPLANALSVEPSASKSLARRIFVPAKNVAIGRVPYMVHHFPSLSLQHICHKQQNRSAKLKETSPPTQSVFDTKSQANRRRRQMIWSASHRFHLVSGPKCWR